MNNTFNFSRDNLKKIMQDNVYDFFIIGEIHETNLDSMTSFRGSPVKYLKTIIAVTFDEYDPEIDWDLPDQEEVKKQYVIMEFAKFESEYKFDYRSKRFSTMNQLWQTLKKYDFTTIKDQPELADKIKLIYE